VRLSAGILTQVTQELECRVDPANIPSRIEVDVTNINVGGSVHVSDLTIPAGVEVLNGGGDTVLTVSASKASDERHRRDGRSDWRRAGAHSQGEGGRRGRGEEVALRPATPL
jgi:hypothetical protein